MTGPNILPTAAVPRDCTMKSPNSTTSESGTMYGVKTGVASLSPSTAPSTVMAGVIMPSP